jgi:hypothetical protein
MKLQAMTVCVHGAHLLSSSLTNRHQFDRWLIITVPRDAETIALCKAHGIECVTTGILRPDGADLYDRDNLARVSEEALARLDPDGWLVVLSEHVVLPRTFRAQILAATLETDCEYRLAGVRHSPNQQVFERLAALEPWRAVPTSVLPEEPSFRMFMRSGNTAPVRMGQLALTALTVSDACSPPKTGVGSRSEARQSLMDWLGAHGQGKTRTAMVAGYYPGLDLERFASLFEAVYLQDLHDLKGNDGLRSLWAGELKRLAPPIRARVRELSLDNGADISSAKIDLLYLPGEVSPEAMLPCLPVWRRVLDPDAIVCGELYGMANWPEATSAIAQLFGRPRVEPAGFWLASLGDAPLRWTASATAGPRASNGSDIIQLAAGDSSDEDVLLSLYSLRKAWSGAIQVNAPQANPALQLQCALLGGNWHTRDGGAGSEPGIAISAGTLALGPIGLNQPVAKADADSSDGFASNLLQRIGLTRKPASLVHYCGDPARWTRKAQAARSRVATDMYRALFPAIRTAADSTVATIVDPSTLPAFKAQWPRWVFDATPVIIANAGVDQAELDWAAALRNVQFVEIEPAEAASPTRTLKRIISQIGTKRLILLPAGSRPLPGATLFAEQALSSDPIILHSSVEVPPVGGVAPLPERHEPLAACMDVALAREVCRAKVVKHKGGIGALLNRALQAGQARWSTCNLAREGWQFEPRPPHSGAR